MSSLDETPETSAVSIDANSLPKRSSELSRNMKPKVSEPLENSPNSSLSVMDVHNAEMSNLYTTMLNGLDMANKASPTNKFDSNHWESIQASMILLISALWNHNHRVVQKRRIKLKEWMNMPDNLRCRCCSNSSLGPHCVCGAHRVLIIDDIVMSAMRYHSDNVRSAPKLSADSPTLSYLLTKLSYTDIHHPCPVIMYLARSINILVTKLISPECILDTSTQRKDMFHRSTTSKNPIHVCTLQTDLVNEYKRRKIFESRVAQSRIVIPSADKYVRAAKVTTALKPIKKSIASCEKSVQTMSQQSSRYSQLKQCLVELTDQLVVYVTNFYALVAPESLPLFEKNISYPGHPDNIRIFGETELMELSTLELTARIRFMFNDVRGDSDRCLAVMDLDDKVEFADFSKEISTVFDEFVVKLATILYSDEPSRCLKLLKSYNDVISVRCQVDASSEWMKVHARFDAFDLFITDIELDLRSSDFQVQPMALERFEYIGKSSETGYFYSVPIICRRGIWLLDAMTQDVLCHDEGVLDPQHPAVLGNHCTIVFRDAVRYLNVRRIQPANIDDSKRILRENYFNDALRIVDIYSDTPRRRPVRRREDATSESQVPDSPTNYSTPLLSPLSLDKREKSSSSESPTDEPILNPTDLIDADHRLPGNDPSGNDEAISHASTKKRTRQANHDSENLSSPDCVILNSSNITRVKYSQQQQESLVHQPLNEGAQRKKQKVTEDTRQLSHRTRSESTKESSSIDLPSFTSTAPVFANNMELDRKVITPENSCSLNDTHARLLQYPPPNMLPHIPKLFSDYRNMFQGTSWSTVNQLHQNMFQSLLSEDTTHKQINKSDQD